jgi:hypothetical protein
MGLQGRWRIFGTLPDAAEQRVPGETEQIQFEDSKGKWHTETASGSDRPITTIKDKG